MAELINREPIVKRVKTFAEYEWNSSRKQAYMEFLDMLTDAPTVTEAEIRNKVIDEFAEKLCDAFSENYGEVTVNGIKFDVLTLDGATEITWDVAEQLKGE